MRFLLLIILLTIFLSKVGYAQKQNDILSKKHVIKLEKINNQSKKLKKYRKFYKKDSIKIIKNRRKLFSKKLDSLRKGLKYYAKTGIVDTLKFPEDYRQYLTENKLDSGNISEKATSILNSAQTQWLNKNPAHKNFLESHTKNRNRWLSANSNDSITMKNMPDSLFAFGKSSIKENTKLLKTKINSLNETQSLKKQMKETSSVAGLQNTYKTKGEHYFNKGQQFTNKDRLLEQGKSTVATHARQSGTQLLNNNGLISSVQSQMTVLKKKYSSITNCNDLTSSIKRNSLQGRPLGERIVLGGNFNIGLEDPVKVNLSPLVGLRITKRLTFGIGGTYRFTFGHAKRPTVFGSKAYGFNAFVSYEVGSRIFGYSEFAYNAGIKKDKTNDREVTVWQSSLAIGVGRSFQVSTKITGTIILLYSLVNSSIQNPNSNNFQIKFGFQTNELTFKKRKKPQ